MPSKRKNAAVEPKATKKVKTVHTPTRRSPRHQASDDIPSPHSDVETKSTTPRTSRAVKPQGADEDHEWEILDGDNRETLLVGVTAPNRLTLRFRHRHDKQAKIAEHKYGKTASVVDWSSKEDIMDINKWRNQVFNRGMKFPPKIARTGWIPFETAYLELLHEKLKRVASTDENFVMPHNTRILDSFNEYFEYRDDIPDKKGVMEPLGARTMGQLASYMNRPGTKLRQLRKYLAKYNTSNDTDAYFPTMTDTEIQSYLDADETSDLTDDDPVSEAHAQDTHSASPSPPRKRPNLSKPQGQEPAHQNAPNDAPSKKKPRWVKPKETAVIPSTPSHIASLTAQGFVFTLPPVTDQGALEVHNAAQEKNPPPTQWIQQATANLDDRITRRSSHDFQHEHFNRDVQDQYNTRGALKAELNWHNISARRDGAAAVTGLLNAADLPPWGYTGDVRDLHRKRLLPGAELEVADARDGAIEKKYGAVEKARVAKMKREMEMEGAEDGELARYEREGRLQREDLCWDSDVAGESDTDVEDGVEKREESQGDSGV
ncbi:hypothetical protein G6011_11744 [Alternaria panax]|uniref:Uncharacterized protein n=1 Tax=Alternaria panax TaxID=48097 RepID=A0AAD4F6X5_9PLEO|nr:hypothetical protein G6011_11744 [Alternaria panax]